MKRILITGKNSYIGTSVEHWLLKSPDEYLVETLDVRDESWKAYDFSCYDVVFHVAGIAHVKESRSNQNIYYEVNRDLAYETAKIAKEQGVKHFIFLSTMSVYGINEGVIDKMTVPKPITAYGISKLEAEELITSLGNSSFSVAILRPPMVYGKGCKGNYPKLVKLALLTPVFPNINNKRSMIYIDNLSEFVLQLILNKNTGLYFPQNKEYINTTEMVALIAKNHGKRLILTKLLNPIVNSFRMKEISKLFGNLTYDMDLSSYSFEYCVYEFDESIKLTEN